MKVATEINSEEEEIQKAKINPKHFRPLYERYYKTIFLFVLYRTGDKEITADITSQVFLQAITHISKHQNKGLSFSAWLYRIAINECNTFFRKNKRERCVVLDDEVVDNFYDNLFEDDPMEDLKIKLPYLLETLKPDQLEIIQLRFMENRPFKEVAEILGITESNAKIKTYRILERMKKKILTTYKN